MRQWSIMSALAMIFIHAQAQDVGPVIISEDEVRQIDEMVNYYEANGMFSGAILVAQKGEIYYHKAIGFSSIEQSTTSQISTRFGLESVSKTLTAIGIMKLKEKGKISLDIPIGNYVSELKAEIADHTTIRQLLHHTSGFPASFVPSAQYIKKGWSRKELLNKINQIDLVYDQGLKYSYSNIGYQTLALIIESVTHQKFERFLSEEIFKPLKMTDTGFPYSPINNKNVAKSYRHLPGYGYEKTEIDHPDFIRGAGGIYTTVEDIHKLDRALYTEELLSKQSVDEIFSKGKLSNYGFGWSIWDYYISGDKRKSVSSEGGGPSGTAIVSRWLNDEVLIVILSNMRHSQVDGLRSKIASIIAGAPLPYPPKPIEFSLVETLLEKGLLVALDFHNRALDNPDYRKVNSGSLNRLAYQYLRSGRLKEARKIFELYIELFPTSSYAYDGYAEALAMSGDLDKSIINYEKALMLNYSNTAARHALMKRSLPPEIIHDAHIKAIANWTDLFIQSLDSTTIKQKLKESGHNEKFIAAVATNFFRHERAQEGSKLFLFNVTAFPNSSTAWYNYGRSLQAMEKKEEAIRAYEKSIKLDPENKSATRMLERIKN